jgi:hypothetical protein
MEAPSVRTNRSSLMREENRIPKLNQENTTNMTRENTYMFQHQLDGSTNFQLHRLQPA